MLFTAGLPGNQITSLKVIIGVKTLQLLCGLALLHPSLLNHLEPKLLRIIIDTTHDEGQK